MKISNHQPDSYEFAFIMAMIGIWCFFFVLAIFLISFIY